MSRIITLDRKIHRPFTYRDPDNPEHTREDLELVRQNKLTVEDFAKARTVMFDRRGHLMNPVRIEHRDRFGILKKMRYSHNLRTNDGADWQARAMGGGPNSSTLPSAGFIQNAPGTAVAITAPTGTTAGKVTDTNASITAATAALNQFLGCTLLYADPTAAKAAHIVGNSASGASSVIWYFDNWFLPTDWTVAAAAPSVNHNYAILPGSPTLYVGLTTTAISPAATDHLLSGEITTNGLLRSPAAGANEWAHTASGTSYQLKNVFSSTGTFTAVQGCGMFTGFSFPNDAAGDLTNVGKGGGVMVFENTFTSTNLLSGDTLTVTWTVNY